MPKIQFYPLDITYRVKDNKPYIMLFGRAVDGKTITIIDDSFMPYFWVILKKGHDPAAFIKSIEGLTEKDKDDVFKIITADRHKRNYLGDDVEAIKVTVNQPFAVVRFREKLEKSKEVELVLESNIKFAKRYLIDRNIVPTTLYEVDGEMAQEKVKTDYIIKADNIVQVSDDSIMPKIMAFDIETYNPAGKGIAPDKNPILMISFFGKDIKKVITWKRFKTKHSYIEFVDDERALINAFKDFVDEHKPDILVGYYSDGFDFPYIKERAEKYKISLGLGWDFSSVGISKGKTPAVNTAGMTHLDVFRFIKFVMGGSLDTDYYDLSSVAQEILGEKKIDVDLDDLSTVWDNDDFSRIEHFCEYNLHDSNLTYKLCEKIMPNLIELVKIVSLPMFDVARMSFSQLVESYLIKQAPLHNVLVPNKPGHDEIAERLTKTYKGAFVFEPKAGLYKDIVVFDFRSLYPTIIASHNISPENLNRKDCSEDERDYVPFDEDKHRKIWFCRGKKRFIPKMIEELVARRMRIKEIMKKKKDKMLEARSYSLKILANASYGYLGFYASRWYSIECADAITAYGRHYITTVIKKAEHNGFKVIYSDTDSIFLTLDGKDKKDALSFIEKINNELPDLMELEFEGFYPRGIFVSAKLTGFGAKKKYALISEDGSIKVKGFEVVRRNWSPIAKEVQQNVLKIILDEDNVKKAIDYVQDVIKSLRENKIELSKVTLYMQLQKDIGSYENEGPHVAAAKRMEKKGIPIGPGTVIEYVIISGKEKIRDRARLPEEVKQKDYDADYYINNQVVPAVESIFTVLGKDIKEMVAGKSQSRLGQFF